MSIKKSRQKTEKKTKKRKTKKFSNVESLDNVVKSEIGIDPDGIEVLDDQSGEELLEKERARAQKMEDRYLRVNAEFENYKKRMIRESSDRV